MKFTSHMLLLAIVIVTGWGTALGQVVPKQKKAKKKPRPALIFSPKGGFYDNDIQVELNCPGAKVFYTTDGSQPNSKSTRYKEPIDIKKTTVLRAVAYKNKRRSKYIGHTYFIDEPESSFPVVSLGIDPSTLFDPESGLYMKGATVDTTWKKEGANFWSKKEVKVNSEIFEANNENVFNSVTGFRLFGGVSRLFPQKSMTLVARDRYGKKRIKHPIFGDDGLKKFKFLVLRNSGSDWGKSHFRDAMMTSLLEDWDMEKQDVRPAHVYLNGKYWGIYNFREKINRYFIEGHHDIDKDSVDLIEHRLSLKRGTKRHYLKLQKYLKTHSLKDPANYAYVKGKMEVDNFMNYQIAQIFFDNQDAGGNIKFWRPQKPNGKWRWIMYDTDWGFGLHNNTAYKTNSLNFHTEANGPSWPNPPWSTLILRKLLENQSFKKQFVNRFADHLNTTFDPEKVLNTIDEFTALYEPEIERHQKRWRLSSRTWKNHINLMRKFARRRPEYVRMHLMEMFKTGEMAEVSVVATPGGEVVLNDNIRINSDKVFRGSYFENYAIQLKAVPQFGYRFSHWEGIEIEEGTNQLTLKVSRKNAHRLKAVFESYTHPLVNKINFNEISCNNKLTGDWVEIYNNSKESVNLHNWIITDYKKEHKLPDVDLAPEQYLIICEDTTSFNKVFEVNVPVIGNLPFGLNKRKESVALYTSDGASIDQFAYELEPTDSIFTLGLLLPNLDNSDQENWEINYNFGSPNQANPYYLESKIKAEQEMWVQIGIGIGILLSCLLLLKVKNNQKKKVVLTQQQYSKPDQS